MMMSRFVYAPPCTMKLPGSLFSASFQHPLQAFTAHKLGVRLGA